MMIRAEWRDWRESWGMGAGGGLEAESDSAEADRMEA